MKIDRRDGQYYEQTVRQLCELARSICSSHAEQAFQFVRKEDRSPVTELDREIELALRACVSSRHPDDSIIGEEFGLLEGAQGRLSARRWVIDPLDGTKAFVTGSPLWGTLIGVLNEGMPWLGAIEMPALHRRFFSFEIEAVCEDDSLRTSRCSELAAARLCTTTPDKFTSVEQSRFDRLSKSVAVHRYGGDCFNYAALATGRCDLVVEAGLAPHDFLPIVPVVQQAGGVMTDWQGQVLSEHSAGNVLAASTPALHSRVLQTFAAACDE
ncbi:inositol monophosphatase family protein [Paraburkholderia fungorum]|uniref:Inositol phosphatase n=1 Tax=Paraburkholderia fungorum TaxID=134537 RepID=A0A3R7HJW7_9BURK|nr:inositol monophosphatase family protein [Paraburkholderia fungorum]RKF31479.1 inositol phosphatase [Paraburkholderia fungorum]